MREHTPTERTPPLPRPCAPPDRCRAVLPCLRTEPPSDPHQRRFLRGAESIPTPSISPPLDRQRAIPQGRIGESVYDSRPSDEKRRRRLGSLPTCRASPPRPHDPSSAAQVSGPRGRAPAAAQPPPCLHESQSCLWSGPSGGPAVLRCGACPAISTPSLPAQGEQRRSSNFNIRRGNPDQFSRSPYFSNPFSISSRIASDRDTTLLRLAQVPTRSTADARRACDCENPRCAAAPAPWQTSRKP
jgi:hypothetical protein